MRTLLLTFVAVVLATGMLLSQGTISVPFTEDQQKGVQYVLGIVNAERAAQDPPLPPLALAAYGRQVCQEVYTNYADQRAAAQEVVASVRANYLLLNDTNKTAAGAFIDNLLAAQ